MYRIGILGAESSHAPAFAKLCNVPCANGEYAYADMRITAVCGDDCPKERTEQVALEGKIEKIVSTPKELFGEVDAVMVLYRRGNAHIPAVLPFIERGCPVWIDKPIAESADDIKVLLETARARNALVTGGSTLKYGNEVLKLKKAVENGELGEVSGGFMSFGGDFESPHGGIFFYGSHLCEMCLSVFGYDPLSVTAVSQNPKNTSVIVRYADRQVTLSFNALAGENVILAQGSEKTLVEKPDLSVIYKLGFERFAQMLRTKTLPLTLDELVKPVYMLIAIEKSLHEGREVKTEEVIK